MSPTETTIYLLVVILDDLERMPALLEAWNRIGLPGVTILDSVGAHGLGGWLSQMGLGALDRLFEAGEVKRRTLLAAMDDPALLDRAVSEAERVVGDFDEPDTGILLVLPVLRASGLHRRARAPRREQPAPAIPAGCRDQLSRSVESLPGVLETQPAVVPPDAPLTDVAAAMVAHPRMPIACVVSPEGHLLGTIDVHSVADFYLTQLSPEEMLGDVSDLDDVMKLADASRMRTAGDAMKEATWVARTDTVKAAFHNMQERGVSGLPVLDESHRVVGYLDWVALFTAFLECPGPRGETRKDNLT